MKDLAVENYFMSVVFLTVPALVHKIRKGPESNFGRRFHEMYFWVDICKYTGYAFICKTRKSRFWVKLSWKLKKLLSSCWEVKRVGIALINERTPLLHTSYQDGQGEIALVHWNWSNVAKKPLILTISIWTCISPLAHKAALHYKAANASGVGHVSSTHIFPTIDCMVPH